MTVHPFPRRPAAPTPEPPVPPPPPEPPPMRQIPDEQDARADYLMLVIAVVCFGLAAFSAALGWGP